MKKQRKWLRNNIKDEDVWLRNNIKDEDVGLRSSLGMKVFSEAMVFIHWYEYNEDSQLLI
jgi:hypothetical protein